MGTLKTRVRKWECQSTPDSNQLYEQIVSKIAADLASDGRLADEVRLLAQEDQTKHALNSSNIVVPTTGILTPSVTLTPGTWAVENFLLLTTTEFNNSGYTYKLHNDSFSKINNGWVKNHIGANNLVVDNGFDGNKFSNFSVITENSSSPTLIRAFFVIEVVTESPLSAHLTLSNASGNLTLMKNSFIKAKKI